ncbi:MAG: M67 family metallopeptidase [Chitinophagales bacterium]|nr:M67 family metallopeptidase [Chitinophagales bacterium]MCZ2392236.1 M67 family metallopeptidase [Chitinophagales bacterium]
MYHTIFNQKAEIIIRTHAEKEFPNECVGFLYGFEQNGKRTIELARPIANSKEGDQRRRFEISPIDYIKAEQYALTHQTTLIGVYHSHPQHPAIPSEHDLKQALPFFSYIIVSVIDGQSDILSSWRLNEEKNIFEQEF